MDIGAHPPTRATADDAVRLARDLYGLEAQACPLSSEYDDNFRLETADGTIRVLKVMHPMRDAGFVDMQCAALRRIAERDPGLPVPEVLPDRSGRAWSTTSLGDGPARLVWMLSYLPGRPIAGIKPVTSGLLEELGTTLARLDAALAGFSHPATRRELKWDLTRAAWIRGHLDSHPGRAPPRPRRKDPGPLRRRGRAGPAAPAPERRLRRRQRAQRSRAHRAGAGPPPGRPHRLRRHDRDPDGGRGRRRRGLRRLRRARPARSRPAARRRLPSPLPAHRRGDRRSRHPHPHAPRGERRQLRLPGRGRARRSLSHDQRGPGLGRSGGVRPGPRPAGPLYVSRRLRPASGAARPGRRRLAERSPRPRSPRSSSTTSARPRSSSWTCPSAAACSAPTRPRSRRPASRRRSPKR